MVLYFITRNQQPRVPRIKGSSGGFKRRYLMSPCPPDAPLFSLEDQELLRLPVLNLYFLWLLKLLIILIHFCSFVGVDDFLRRKICNLTLNDQPAGSTMSSKPLFSTFIPVNAKTARDDTFLKHQYWFWQNFVDKFYSIKF